MISSKVLWAWFDKFSRVIGAVRLEVLFRSFYLYLSWTVTVVLVVYIDDIMLTENDIGRIMKTMKYLKQQFVTKNMGKPRHFLRIEIDHDRHGSMP